MKAKQTFIVLVNKDGNLSPLVGIPITINAGEEVDSKLLPTTVNELLNKIPDYLDVVYKQGYIVLSEAEKVKYNFYPGPKPIPAIMKTMIVNYIKKYTQESLTILLNSKGKTALSEILYHEFGIKKLAKTSTGSKLIQEILTAEEKKCNAVR